jgi:hypothetical protein
MDLCLLREADEFAVLNGMQMDAVFELLCTKIFAHIETLNIVAMLSACGEQLSLHT